MTTKVLFASQWDPSEPSSWSGTPYFMLSALRELTSVEVVSLGRPLWMRGAGRIATELSRRTWSFDRAGALLDAYARSIERAAGGDDEAVVIAPSSIPVSRLAPGLRAAYWTDSVFPQLVGFYPQRLPYARWTVEAAERQERAALGRTQAAAYSSEWAIAGAQRLAPDSTPLLLEFGPNLTAESVARIRRLRERRRIGADIRLLWIGVHWQRKGGDIAVGAAEVLAGRGSRVVLDTVGVSPPTSSSVVRDNGTLSKAVPDQLARLEALLGEADALVIPSRADCTPVVVSEAIAVGLPVVVSDVGGLGEMARRSGAGVSVPVGGDEAVAVADAVTRMLDEREGYEAAAHRAAATMSYRTGFEALLARLAGCKDAVQAR
jgi:glycosyltransferase involved in cell wall biosynthesis